MSTAPFPAHLTMSRYAAQECFQTAERLWAQEEQEKAIEYYNLAAHYAHPGARLHLGILFLEGAVLPRDSEKAKDFFNLIVLQELTDAEILSTAAKTQRESARQFLELLENDSL